MFEDLTELVSKYKEENTADISRESDFFDELGFNSYEFMCLLEDIEDELGIYVSDIEAEGIRTVGDLLSVLEKK